MAAAGGGGAGYVIEGSGLLNDNDSAYMSKTFSGAADSTTTYTLSLWFKRGNISLGATTRLLTANGVSDMTIGILSDDTLTWSDQETDAPYDTWYLTTTQVLRDPAAWYNLVLCFDSTNGTAGNRMRMWLNGVEVTDFDTDTNPDLNANSAMGSAIEHFIGSWNASLQYFDGYISEFVYLDGAAVTDATDFGEFDDQGYWRPIDVTGLTFGTNGFLLEGGVNVAAGTDSSTEAVVAEASTSGVWLGDTGSYTFSGADIASSATDKALYFNKEFAGDFTVEMDVVTQFLGTMGFIATSEATSVMLTNGAAATTFVFKGAGTAPGLHTGYTGTADHVMSTTEADGTTVKWTRVGSVWKFYLDDVLEYTFTGTYTGPVRLRMDTHGAGGTLNVDNINWTGNTGHHFTPSGTITATNDSPTNGGDSLEYGNYNTFDPNSDIYDAGTFSNGNLNYVSGSATYTFVMGTLGMMSGVWYWEVEKDAGSVESSIGVTNIISSATTHELGTANGQVTYKGSDTGYVKSDGSNVSTGDGAIGNGDIVSIRLDLDAGTPTIKFYKNDGLLYSHNLTANQDPAQTGKPLFTAVGDADSGATCTFKSDFGQLGFTYSLPADHSALHTANMPTPAIPDPTEHHQVELVAHDGSSTAFTCNWDADVYDTLFIIKNRDSVEKWYWVDGLNGYGKYHSSDQSAQAQQTDANVLGVSGTTITLGSTLANDAYVVECHRGGAAGGVTNTDGDNTTDTDTTVSVNSVTEFAIIKYTGTASANTFGHGLSVAPDFWTIFRDDTGANHGTYHSVIGNTGALRLDTTDITSTDTSWWNDTSPTASVFSLGAPNTTTNNSGDTYTMYAWAAVEGYSAFGSYEGNSDDDGPMITSNFKTETFIRKRTTTASNNWNIWYSTINDYNTDGMTMLAPNTTGLEDSNTGYDNLDVLSNGVKIHEVNDSHNLASNTYIYSMWGGRPIQGPKPASNTSQGRAR